MLLSNKATCARAAMAALIERGMPLSELDPGFPKAVARLAWAIADAMADEHMDRSGRERRGPR